MSSNAANTSANVANAGALMSAELTPPEVIVPTTVARTVGAVKLPDTMKMKVDAQLSTFMQSLMKSDPHSEEFKLALDAAFTIGRHEIAQSTAISNRFASKGLVGVEDSSAYKAIANMRSLFDELNPAKQGDLFSAAKILGIPIPFGNKLTRYIRKYQSASTQIAAIQSDILAAKDDIAKDVAEMSVAQQQMWAAMEKLEGATYFITTLDEKLSATIASIKSTEPERARAFEQDVLYYVRQNLGDVLTAQALTVNAYNVMGELRKTGRETMTGCDRVATLGTAALSIAVSLARATGNQITTQAMISGSKQEIENLIASTGEAMNTHVDLTAKFSSEPVIGVQTLQKMFNKTFEAMDKMEKYRSVSIETMRLNNQMITSELSKAKELVAKDLKVSTAAEPVLFL